MARRTIAKATRLQAQCQALNEAIFKGVIVQANIQATMRRILSMKSDATTGTTFLFHDEQENLCMFQVAPSQEIELIVKLGSEVQR